MPIIREAWKLRKYIKLNKFGAAMNPKKVWGIVLILLGVLFVLDGISGYHDTSFYGNEIESMGRMIKKYGGKVGNELYNADQYQDIIRKEKIKYIFILLLGVAGAIGGTLMLKDSYTPKTIEYDEDQFETEPAENERWRL